MLRSATLASGTFVLVCLAAAPGAGSSGPARTFDGDAAGRAPQGFTFHVARQTPAAHWEVQREGTNGFLTHRGEGRAGFALAVLDAATARNVTVSARLRLPGGQRSAGVVWRLQDADNYYLARLDLDRQDIGLYRIAAGNRTRIEGEDDLELDNAAWHTLRIVHEDEEIRVYLGGIRVLRARDRTFMQAGAAGVWCADAAIAHFDDLRVEALAARDGERDHKDADSHRRR